MQGSQTLGKSKKHKTSQRHSAGNIDYDNLPGGTADDVPAHSFSTFRTRSKTVGDTAGESLASAVNGPAVQSGTFLSPDPPKFNKHGELEKDAGTKSEGEEELPHIIVKKSLGRTPDHLTLR